MPTRRRADAERSREAIVAAFSELVRERGEDVPMYEVAKRAGVGQGTLYRHFPQREMLAAALFEASVDELERIAAAEPDDPALFTRLLWAGIENQARVHSLSTALLMSAQGEHSASHLTERTLRVFERPLRVAQDKDAVRADLNTQDVMTVLAMIEGVLSGLTADADRVGAARRAFELISGGLRKH